MSSGLITLTIWPWPPAAGVTKTVDVNPDRIVTTERVTSMGPSLEYTVVRLDVGKSLKVKETPGQISGLMKRA